MGLDMYMWRKSYVKNWDHMEDSRKHKITVLQGGHERSDIKPERISEITEEVAYWRKANHIHKWFVDNVQDGEDDCGEYYVSNDKLLDLITKCEAVLSDKDNAPNILPCQSGFFFGGTEYDEYYFKDCENTIAMLKPFLGEKKASLYYSSSW